MLQRNFTAALIAILVSIASLANAAPGDLALCGAIGTATTSSPNLASGDNFLFTASFDAASWSGELIRQTLDIASGAATRAADWSARDRLDRVAATDRRILLFSATAASKLRNFYWAGLTPTEQAYFRSPHIDALSQMCTLGASCLAPAARAAASGRNLVDYLRGDRSQESSSFGATDTARPYRKRAHLLGDIVGSAPVYVKQPIFNYDDDGYAAFKAAGAARAGTVYVAANDGMLHAFDADTGVERWAYVPTALLPKLFRLADKNYASHHEYFADGTPVIGDVFVASLGAWRTILVAGLGAGGRAYYALDITDPAAPRGLWEFSASDEGNLGLSFGKPQITKLKDGTWTALLTSGYDNVGSGDGRGYVYVVDAATGHLIRTIGTGRGSMATPGGLAQIRAWADHGERDNTATRAYGGDLLGNLWRFDLDGGKDAQLLVTLADDRGNPQPITARPELGEVRLGGGTKVPMIFVGSGRMLGPADLADTSTQTIYGIKDTLASVAGPIHPSARDESFVRQTLSESGSCGSTATSLCAAGQAIRTASNNPVDLAANNGWYVDLPEPGERVISDPVLQLGTLAFSTLVPASGNCADGGRSWINFLDFRTGGTTPIAHASGSEIGSVESGNGGASQPQLIRLASGKILRLVRQPDGATTPAPAPIGEPSAGVRRVSWRQLPVQ
jgi:type IV pilus assembly protein PilY1